MTTATMSTEFKQPELGKMQSHNRYGDYHYIRALESRDSSASEIFIFEKGVRHLMDCCRRANEGNPKKFAIEFSSSEHRFRGRTFMNWADIERKAMEPWPEGVQVVDRMIRALEAKKLPTPKSRKRKGIWNEFDGDDFNLDRFRSGQAHWRTTQKAQGRGPNVVTIINDVSANCNVDHEDILWRGAASVALTKILENAGYRVEVWSCWASRDMYDKDLKGNRSPAPNMFAAVRLKMPRERLDVGTLINGVSGWFFRTVMFAASNLADQQPGWGLGRAATITPYVHRITESPATIVVEGVWNEKDAVNLIAKKMAFAVGESNIIQA